MYTIQQVKHNLFYFNEIWLHVGEVCSHQCA